MREALWPKQTIIREALVMVLVLAIAAAVPALALWSMLADQEWLHP